MAIHLEANYAKKLGLPNYSSHQYTVSIRTELTDLSQVEAESARLYRVLQDAVDREIQEVGFMPDASTYGMNPPAANGAGAFVQRALQSIRADRCEHVWAEVFNVRGDSLVKSCEALEKGGFADQASGMRAVSGAGHGAAWEQYARETFLAYTRHLGPEKLRFLQYPTRQSASWWAERRHQGALLLGVHAVGLS